MSYILDALKKADADRERDAAAVPDLHAQADAARGAAALSRHGRGLWWSAAAATAVVIAALAWQWFPAPPAEAPPPVPLAQAPAVPPPAVAEVTPAAHPPDTVVPASPAAVPPEPAPIPSLASKPAPPPVAREAAPAPTVPVVTANTPASAATDPRVPGLSELPADLRARLPALVVGGSMYSPNVRSRMVILNGQVFREGDKPAEGLSVESIGTKSTVLAFRGVRFELKH